MRLLQLDLRVGDERADEPGAIAEAAEDRALAAPASAATASIVTQSGSSPNRRPRGLEHEPAIAGGVRALRRFGAEDGERDYLRSANWTAVRLSCYLSAIESNGPRSTSTERQP